MGFLSNLFRRDNNDDEDDELDEEMDEEEEDEDEDDYEADGKVNPLSNLSVGISLDIMNEGKQVFTARLAAFKGQEMTLDRLPGWISFQILPVGTEVAIRGYNRRMEQFNLTAKVKESTRTLCKLEDVRAAVVDNVRNNFRIYMNAPAWLYRKGDEKYLHPENCTLIDVSTGGCCIESEYAHVEDEVLRVKIKLEDYQSMQFLGQIIRVTACEGGRYRYGILFAQLREDELTALTRTLYNLQVGNRQEWIQSEKGTWH